MSYTYTRLENPRRIELAQHGQWVATFTPGCYTVRLSGPERTFGELFRKNNTQIRVEVIHNTWVRAAPGPVDEEVDERWLARALAANESGVVDALGIAMQYVKGAPPLMLDDLQIAGDASYGPLDSNGRREEGSDFNDYLQLRWLYPTEAADTPEHRQARCLDCSGYVRMVWGYRGHLPGSGVPDSIPLSRAPGGGATLPRRAFELYEDAPGLVQIPDTGQQVTEFDALEIGDLVFFDADPDDGVRIDHVGVYLGADVLGMPRFISSRKTADGPTFADLHGASVLSGTGFYARAFRAVRRL